MAVTAHDLQLCLWKMLKFSSKTCVTLSLTHPYLSLSLLFLLLLYICFPLAFWILAYSLPLVVCTCVVLSISFNGVREKKIETRNSISSEKSTKVVGVVEPPCKVDEESRNKAYARVHSVRRRRAKEIARGDEGEEEKAVASTEVMMIKCDDGDANDDDHVVEKSALVEEASPKEIREVEVRSSPTGAKESPFDGLRKGDETVEEMRKGEEDELKNKMDVGIADAERNKRLESLIARRRSRKMLSLQVLRSLMNVDRNEHSSGQMTSLVIPKISASFSPNKMGGPFSPGPGSAPSVLIPMRNPFDLPYDPQEEKPDLTGDSFHQEFTSNSNYRDLMFSRHESFSLGPKLPGEFYRNRDGASSLRDFGFRRGFSSSYRFSKPGDDSERKFAPIMEQKSYEAFESKSDVNSPNDDDDDQIKEIIQVDETDIEDETRLVPQSDFNSSSSPQSSSEEDQPMFKIDREAVLKSLSSMRRNALLEIENNHGLGDNLCYANSALENASRLKQQYYADKPTRRHATSYSIASDMQVEVSEVSSPPLTIDESISFPNEDVSTYDGDMERNGIVSWDSEDMWASSSLVSEAEDDDPRWIQVNEANGRGLTDDEGVVSRIKKPDDDQDDSVSNTLDDDHDQRKTLTEKHHSDGDGIMQVESNSEEIEKDQQVVNMEQHEHSSGEASIRQADVESNDQQVESLMPIQSSTTSPKSVLLPTLSSSNFDPDIDENQVHQTGPNVLHDSTDQLRDLRRPDGASQELSVPTNALPESVNDETSSRSFSHINEASSNDHEATFNQNIHHTAEVDDDNSALHQETGTISDFLDETKQIQDLDACSTSVATSEQVDVDDNSVPCSKQNEQSENSQGSILTENNNSMTMKPSSKSK